MEKVSKIYPEYQKALKEQNALDFDDLISEIVRLFREAPDVLSYYQDKFLFVLVDEYQDTNRAQYVLIKTLTSRSQKLCVVGDVSQSIYSFRGADFRNVLSFEKDYPTSKIFYLPKNYRSTKTIVEASRSVIEHNQTHLKINLATDNSEGEKIFLYEATTEEDEANFVTERVKNSKGGFSDFAVLYRTNAQSRSIEEAFIKESIPYKLVGGTRFYDRKEIKDAISYLRILHNPKDFVSWKRIINVPPRKVGEKMLEQLKSTAFDIEEVALKTTFPIREMLTAQKNLTVLELLDFVLDKSGYLAHLDDGTAESEARVENLKELRSVALRFATLEEFLENIALVNPQDTATDETKKMVSDTKDAVSLMTLHQAKGLEFFGVFIVGLEEGLFPHSRSLESKAEVEEERRLFYVGMTRAKDRLYLTYAKRRLYFGTTSMGTVSRFVSEIPEHLMESPRRLSSKFEKSVDDFLDFLEEQRKSVTE